LDPEPVALSTEHQARENNITLLGCGYKLAGTEQGWSQSSHKFQELLEIEFLFVLTGNKFDNRQRYAVKKGVSKPVERILYSG
jgi:hypothetical protein